MCDLDTLNSSQHRLSEGEDTVAWVLSDFDQSLVFLVTLLTHDMTMATPKTPRTFRTPLAIREFSIMV
jgi:hypothetical protein